MTNKRLLASGIVILLLVVFLINFYFLYRIDVDTKLNTFRAIEQAIKHKAHHLHPMYLNRNPRFVQYRNKLIKNYKPSPYDNASIIFDIVNWWPNENEVYPSYDSTMGQLLTALAKEPITKAKNSVKGTQLKLTLKLSNQQKVIFKPQWYRRDEILDGPVYGGKDRHNAEVYAFFLGAVLDFRWTPISVGRKINLQEIYNKADNDLKRTMILNEQANGTEYCVFGKCHYCTEEEQICGDSENIVEGAILQIIPGTFIKHKSPWQRTYKDGVQAEWEINMNYCKNVKTKLETNILLDLIDASIFDYLLQNGDRHHYETRGNGVVLIDNGKAFGNPSKDFLDILAPLYQCCLLRKNTWERLKVFSGGVLTTLIDRMTKSDILYPLITDKNKRAIEKRLITVYAVVEYCIDVHGEKILKT